MELLIPEIIRNKRDGGELSAKEIRRFIEGVTSGEVTDAQIAAFSMAAFFRRPQYGGTHGDHTIYAGFRRGIALG